MLTVSCFVFTAAYMTTTPVNLVQVRAVDLQCSTSCQKELNYQRPTHPAPLQAAVKLSSHSPTSAIAGQPGYKELYLRLFEKGQEFFQHKTYIPSVSFFLHDNFSRLHKFGLVCILPLKPKDH